MYDINKDNTERIVDFCKENAIDVIGKVTFNPIITEAMVNGKPIVEYAPGSDVANEIETLWKNIVAALKLGSD
jgi:MinD superfamily P-loop ATPase